MKILFTSDCNGWEFKDPRANLIEMPEMDDASMKKLEHISSNRFSGGAWQDIMKNGNITFTEIKSGKKSDFQDNEYDREYKLYSGNY